MRNNGGGGKLTTFPPRSEFRATGTRGFYPQDRLRPFSSERITFSARFVYPPVVVPISQKRSLGGTLFQITRLIKA